MKSTYFNEVINLLRLIRYHKDKCDTLDCGISIWYSKQTVERLIKGYLHGNEYDEAYRLLNEIEL